MSGSFEVHPHPIDLADALDRLFGPQRLDLTDGGTLAVTDQETADVEWADAEATEPLDH